MTQVSALTFHGHWIGPEAVWIEDVQIGDYSFDGVRSPSGDVLAYRRPVDGMGDCRPERVPDQEVPAELIKQLDDKYHQMA